jgi:hypothetical protein
VYHSHRQNLMMPCPNVFGRVILVRRCFVV